MKKTFSISKLDFGHIGKDLFGRIYIDRCPDDATHMAAPLKEGEQRRMCRWYIEDVFEEMVGLEGTLKVQVMLDVK